MPDPKNNIVKPKKLLTVNKVTKRKKN